MIYIRLEPAAEQEIEELGEADVPDMLALVERTKLDPEKIDDVVFAQGYGNGEAPCIARYSALAADLPI